MLPDTLLCPLCGRSNQCAVSAGTPAEDCWCMTATISPSALAQLPDSARGQSCLCPACAAGATPAPPADPH
ncbi:cysteine-rich CWC family protein [Acidovorax sp. Be4]|uniref:Cysteine-rich CWC family protein n=1 Tax=Acidovorax bellezanensis TaxID=2976702 RepID=A0ABT2PJE0_9BURK|nr:cysteine-rich CWC family protein [Acidovorax sp. Be4]MCT9810598.1 cysteine-rich CWC family protein [Acidovorax sp. Be4]